MLSQLKTVKSDLYKCSYPHPEHYPLGGRPPMETGVERVKEDLLGAMRNSGELP
jgi:hypothetical protein